MTFYRRKEIKPNDGGQSLTRNLCSGVATAARITPTETAILFELYSKRMDVTLPVFTCIIDIHIRV